MRLSLGGAINKWLLLLGYSNWHLSCDSGEGFFLPIVALPILIRRLVPFRFYIFYFYFYFYFKNASQMLRQGSLTLEFEALMPPVKGRCVYIKYLVAEWLIGVLVAERDTSMGSVGPPNSTLGEENGIWM